MASSAYSDPTEFHRYFPIESVVNNLNTTQHQRSRASSSQSPWSATSQVSADHLTLTLPSLSPGDLAEDPSLYQRLQSPSSYLPETSMAVPLHSIPQHPPVTLPRPHRNMDHYHVPDSESADLFLNFEGTSQPQFRHSPLPHISSIVDLTTSSPLNMAPPRKRKHNSDQAEDSSKRIRGDTEAETGKLELPTDNTVEKLDLEDVDNDEEYEDFLEKQQAQQADLIKQQNVERAGKPIKLTDFQCIICLDNPTDLTVTHCGHLFCSVCLHEALHAGTQRRTCPVCRQQINLTKNKEGKQPKNGVFVLEMKLMTARKKEKQPQSPWER